MVIELLVAIVILVLALKLTGPWPVLKQLSKRWHAFVSDTMRVKYNESVLEQKKKLFDKMAIIMNLNDIKLLEIGVGSGANFEFLPSEMKIQLIAVEPNEYAKPYLEKNLENYPHVDLCEYAVCPAENMKGIESQSVDCVLSTIVLCSVNDQVQVLKEIRRVLKPGGHFFFMEHVFAKDGFYMPYFQRCLNPLNKILYDGCNVTRNSLDVIKKAGFTDVYPESFNANLFNIFAMFRPHITGYAVK